MHKEVKDTVLHYADEIRDALSIRDVAEAYGLPFNQAGFAICPFHSENTASFKLWDKRRAHCFGCGKTTDVIGLTMILFGLNFRDACEKLNRDFAVGLPIGEHRTIRQRLTEERARKKREREKRESQSREQERCERYWRLLYRWMAYDSILRGFRPVAGEDLSPLYVEAVHNIEYISYLLDRFPEGSE